MIAVRNHPTLHNALHKDATDVGVDCIPTNLPTLHRHHRPIPTRTENVVAQKVIKPKTSARVSSRRITKLLNRTEREKRAPYNSIRGSREKSQQRGTKTGAQDPKQTNQHGERINKNKPKNERTRVSPHHC